MKKLRNSTRVNSINTKLLGIVMFMSQRGDVTWDSSPFYEGEDPLGPEVMLRATRAFSMLRDPRSDPLPHVISTAQRKVVYKKG